MQDGLVQAKGRVKANDLIVCIPVEAFKQLQLFSHQPKPAATDILEAISAEASKLKACVAGLKIVFDNLDLLVPFCNQYRTL